MCTTPYASRWRCLPLLACLITIEAGCSTAAATREEPTTSSSSIDEHARVGLLEGLARRTGSAARRCDALAADADDPGARAAGVDLQDLDAEPALAACTRAVETSPADAPAWLQLGRAELANDNADAALRALRTAKDRGSCAANYYLAVHAQSPWTDDGAVDLPASRTLFQSAIDCGYGPAADALARITLDPSLFVRPDVITELADGKPEAIARLNRLRPLTATVLIGMTRMFGEHWPPGLENTCAVTTLYQPGPLDRALAAAEGGNAEHIGERAAIDLLTKLLGYLDPVWMGETLEKTRAILLEQGRTDALRLMQFYGGCDSPLVQQVAASISLFSQRPRSIVDITKELASEPNAGETARQDALDPRRHGKVFDRLLQPSTTPPPSGASRRDGSQDPR